MSQPLRAQSVPCLSALPCRRACRRLCRRRHSHRGTKSLSGLKMPIAGARILRCSLKRKIAASGQPAGRPAAAALRPLGMPPGMGPHQAPRQLEIRPRSGPRPARCRKEHKSELLQAQSAPCLARKARLAVQMLVQLPRSSLYPPPPGAASISVLSQAHVSLVLSVRIQAG